MSPHLLRRRPSGWQDACRRPGTVIFAALIVLIGSGCDQDRMEGGMAVDNRTAHDLTVWTSVERSDGAVEDVRRGMIEAGQSMALSRSGCSVRGLEARTDDGTVIAALPPREPDLDKCDFLWVITQGDSWTEPL